MEKSELVQTLPAQVHKILGNYILCYSKYSRNLSVWERLENQVEFTKLRFSGEGVVPLGELSTLS